MAVAGASKVGIVGRDGKVHAIKEFVEDACFQVELLILFFIEVPDKVNTQAANEAPAVVRVNLDAHRVGEVIAIKIGALDLHLRYNAPLFAELIDLTKLCRKADNILIILAFVDVSCLAIRRFIIRMETMELDIRIKVAVGAFFSGRFLVHFHLGRDKFPRVIECKAGIFYGKMARIAFQMAFCLVL